MSKDAEASWDAAWKEWNEAYRVLEDVKHRTGGLGLSRAVTDARNRLAAVERRLRKINPARCDLFNIAVPRPGREPGTAEGRAS